MHKHCRETKAGKASRPRVRTTKTGAFTRSQEHTCGHRIQSAGYNSPCAHLRSRSDDCDSGRKRRVTLRAHTKLSFSIMPPVTGIPIQHFSGHYTIGHKNVRRQRLNFRCNAKMQLEVQHGKTPTTSSTDQQLVALLVVNAHVYCAPRPKLRSGRAYTRKYSDTETLACDTAA